MNQQMNVMRARIESELATPSVITVTSAHARDGKTLVATGLAENLAAAGRRVLFIDATENDRTAKRAVDRIVNSAPKLSDHEDYDILSYIARGQASRPDTLGLTAAGVASSCTLETVRTTLARCRSRYDYIVVDTSIAVKSGVGLTFVNAADAILVAFRKGRGADQADRQLVASLESSGTAVLGVILVDRGAGLTRKPSDAPDSVRKVRLASDDVIASGASLRVPLR